MSETGSLWQRLPVIVRATVTGAAVAAVGYLPRNALFFVNLRTTPSVPWSGAAIALYLWLLWRYLSGDGWPRRTAAARRERLRGWLPARTIFCPAAAAGILASVALRCLLDLARRLSTRPTQDLEALQAVHRYPAFTVFILFLATAAIAGVVEEAAFRGYMQQPIEQRHGPMFAILYTSILFCVAHYRPEAADPWPWLIFIPAYFAVGVTLGTLAYATNSIVIGAICHAAIDLAAFLRYWHWGVPPSIWTAGLDWSFWLDAIALAVFALLSFWAFRRLFAVRRVQSADSGVTGRRLA